MPAYLVVRAVVPDQADRVDFDHWYRTEHLPDAVKAFAARAGWRGWSQTDPAVHYAFYRFDNAAAVQAISGGPALQSLIAEFDRRWGARVTRTREIVEVADEMEAKP